MGSKNDNKNRPFITEVPQMVKVAIYPKQTHHMNFKTNDKKQKSS